MEKPEEAFLEELVARAKEYGWKGDYTEVKEFIWYLYQQAGLPVPDLTPKDEGR